MMDMERLTLGGCLTALRDLAHGQYGPQEAWFANCLRSYHRTIGNNTDIDYYSPQSTVSRILSGKMGMPRDMYAYYATHDDMLRQDIAAYLADTIGSCRQWAKHLTVLEDMVIRSSNLDAGDKAYILGYTGVAEDAQLSELLYRMLTVLIREPVVKTA